MPISVVGLVGELEDEIEDAARVVCLESCEKLVPLIVRELREGRIECCQRSCFEGIDGLQESWPYRRHSGGGGIDVPDRVG